MRWMIGQMNKRHYHVMMTNPLLLWEQCSDFIVLLTFYRNVKDVVLCRGSVSSLDPCCSQLKRPSCSLQLRHDYACTPRNVLSFSLTVCAPLPTQQARDCTSFAQSFTACLSATSVLPSMPPTCAQAQFSCHYSDCAIAVCDRRHCS